MRWRRLLVPSKLVTLCAAFFSVLLMYALMDMMLSCNQDEFTAMKKLLQKYTNLVQELRSEHNSLLRKLENAESLLSKSSHQGQWVPRLPIIYLITPTYTRLEQKAELTRISHTLKLVSNIHWIVIEDAEQKTDLVARFLMRSGLNYTHLNAQTPVKFKMASTDPNWLKPRGVLQRNAGLSWLRQHASPSTHPGVIYFADDDNTYSLALFEEMRFTKKVSVWPVGLVGYLRYERPIVKAGKVVKWFTAWKSSRPFAIDMAGFAVNLQLIFDFPEAEFSNNVQRGYQESHFLSHLSLQMDDVEPKARNCTQVLVWHTRTEKSNMKNEDKLIKAYGKGSDPNIEV